MVRGCGSVARFGISSHGAEPAAGLVIECRAR